MTDLDDEMRLMPIGRFDWERLVRRMVMPWPAKSFALLVATWANKDGGRVRPGVERLMAVTGISDSTVRRRLTALHKEWGLLIVVSRGGGRGGHGRTTEYRLSIPDDLLDRHEMLPPSEWPDDGPDDFSPVTQVTGQSDAHAANSCGQPLSTFVDNSETPVTQMTDQFPVDNSIDRSLGTLSDQLTGHWEPIDRSPGCTTTSTDQPTKDTTSNPDPAQPPEAAPVDVDNPVPTPGRSLDDVLPLSKPPKPPPGPKCTHGLTADRHPDGRPRCPLCRRDAVLDAHPIPVPELAPPEKP